MSSDLAVIVVMGVSGVGKTTIGRLLADYLGVRYVDGDDVHPVENIEKMAAGVALNDADRQHWLTKIGDWLCEHSGSGGVVSCSALKRRYRDYLRSRSPGVWFVHLKSPMHVLHERMTQREHFMPTELLGSQLQVLEPLATDEPGVTVDAEQAPQNIVEQIARIAPHT